MVKVLVTGFQPFGGESVNPSFEAVKLIPDHMEDTEIVKRELPVVFKKSIEVLKEIMEEVKPDIVICVGQAGGRFEITPERVGINIDDARIPDNEGNAPLDECIFPDGANAYFSKLPVKAMVKNMQERNIPASLSNTAGTYVCNHIMYGLLYLIDTIDAFKDIRGGFIHVPFCTEQVIEKRGVPSLTVEQIAKGLEVCIQTAVETEKDISFSAGTEH